MRTRPALTLVALSFALVLACATPPASGAPPWLRPVAGRVVRPFRPPLTRFGAGHLGVDFAAAPGTPVRAAAAGTVMFAGTVAHARHVVLLHPGGLRTSYSFLAAIRVHRGEVVDRGAVLGTTGGSGDHHDGTVLHFGLRIGGTFVDPMQLFAAADLAARVHLVSEGVPRSARAGSASAPAAAAVPAVSEPAADGLRAAVAAGERAVALWREWAA